MRFTINSVIKKVTSDLDEKFGFNTSIASLMELINEMYKYKELDGRNSAVIKEGIEAIVTIISPFTPHLGEELWQMIGKEGSVFDISWPEYDEKALVKDEVEVVVQINGKVRGRMNVPTEISRDDMQAAALEDEKIKELVEGKTIVKVWPEYDEKALVKDEVEVVVQINGKVRGRMNVPTEISRDDMQAAALEDEKIKELVEGKTIVKVIAVPKKLIKVRGRMNVPTEISRDDMQAAALEDEKIKELVEGKTIVKVIAVPKKLINIVVK